MMLLAALIALATTQDVSGEDHTSLPELTYHCAPKGGPAFIFVVEGTPKSSRTEIHGAEKGWPEAPILIRDGLRGAGTQHPEGADIGLFKVTGQSDGADYDIDVTLTFPKQKEGTRPVYTGEITIRGPGAAVSANCVMVAKGTRP